MAILCGTDISDRTARAATAAAYLAVRMQEPLHLLHALDVAPGDLSAEPKHPLLNWAETQLGPEAERLRRAKVINAEGEQQAAEKLVEAGRMLAQEPQAMQLRYFAALHDIAGDRSSTVVFPLPMDLLGHLNPKSRAAK